MSGSPAELLRACERASPAEIDESESEEEREAASGSAIELLRRHQRGNSRAFGGNRVSFFANKPTRTQEQRQKLKRK